MDLIQESDRLNCLSKTHLIGHDTGLVVEPTVEKPVKSLHLILTKLIAMLKLWRLFQFAERSARWTRKLPSLIRIGDYLAGVKLVDLSGVNFQNLVPELPSRTIIGGVAPLDQEKDLHFTVGSRQFSFVNNTINLDSPGDRC